MERAQDRPVLTVGQQDRNQREVRSSGTPVPIDMNTLQALKRSSLGLDLYLWLVYRTFPLRAPQRLTWKQLYQQFGAHPANASGRVTVRNFQRKVLRELKKIKDRLGLA